MDGQFRGADENALQDKQFDKPEPVANYTFIQERVDAVKEDVEEETGETFDKFKAVYFLKRDFNYVIRVDCGSKGFIDLKMNKKLLQDFDANKKAGDPMKF